MNDKDDLREQYAAAIKANEPGRTIEQCRETAEFVLAVRDRVVEQLRNQQHHARGTLASAMSALADMEQRVIDLGQEHERADQAEDTLARVRDVVADMRGITGARHWADMLTTALEQSVEETASPAPLDRIPEHELHDAIRKMARIDPAWFRETVRRADADTRGFNTLAAIDQQQEAGQ